MNLYVPIYEQCNQLLTHRHCPSQETHTEEDGDYTAAHYRKQDQDLDLIRFCIKQALLYDTAQHPDLKIPNYPETWNDLM